MGKVDAIFYFFSPWLGTHRYEELTDHRTVAVPAQIECNERGGIQQYSMNEGGITRCGREEIIYMRRYLLGWWSAVRNFDRGVFNYLTASTHHAID